MKLSTKIALFGVSAIAFSAPGYAQDIDSQAVVSDTDYEGVANAGDVIVVTARRRNEDQQDVPSVINTVTQEDLQKLNIRDGSDIQSVVPGLSLSTGQAGIGGNASLRGVDFSVNASGTSTTVDFYINDAPTFTQLFLQTNYDIGQIEVLRGPQGTLRGRASPSGSVTVRTRRPDLYEFGGYANATGTDIGDLNFNGGVGGPIVEGVLGLRVAGLYSEGENTRVRTFNSGPGTDSRDPFSSTESGRVSLVFEPTDWISSYGVYQKLEGTSRSFEQVACLPGAVCPRDVDARDRLSNSDGPILSDVEYDSYTGTVEVAQLGQRLIYTGNFVDQAILSGDPMDDANIVPNAERYRNTVSASSLESHELRLQNEDRLFGMFDYVVGGMFFLVNSANDVSDDTIQSAGGSNSIGAPSTLVRSVSSQEEQSIFGNLTFHPTDRIELSVGARYIDTKKTSDLTVSIPGGPVVLENSNPIQDDATIYSASAKYQVSDDLMVYGTFGTSYRAPLQAVGCFSPECLTPEVAMFTGLDAETSDSYEVGIKSTLFDKLRLNVSAFYQKFDNYVYRAGGEGVNYIGTGRSGPAVETFNFVAAVPVEVKGVEAEIAYEFSDQFNIGATLSYSDGKIKGGTIPCNDSFDNSTGAIGSDGIPDNTNQSPTVAEFLSASGGANLQTCDVSQRSSFAPPFQASVFGEFTAPVNDDVAMFARGLLDFSGNSKNDPSNTIDNIEQFGILDLFAGVRDPDGAWEVTAFAKNIFDTFRVTRRDREPRTSTNAAGTSFTSNYGNIAVNDPQEFGINVRFNFGSDK